LIIEKKFMTDIEQLEQAIAALEAQRSLLSDAIVETMLAPAREKLATLKAYATPSEQQRKHVTILFADVSGFTAMSETLDAEDVTDLMNDLWQRLDRAITEHGGRIDKHIGDAIMALWGTGQAREDDPEQAIRAALTMQNELAAFRDERQITLAMRVGINTGPVLLGTIATTREFTAMGDAVNLSSRLEHAAPVGGVLISSDTYRHVRGLFDVEVQPPLTVKGKREPVLTYRVLAVKPRAFRMATRGVEGIETRTIGRDAELLTLQNAYRDAVETAETHLLTLVGDPGLGKSRLLYEFENWVELLPQTTLYFKGRATPETRHRPAGLLHDLFSFRFDIRDTDPLATAREKFLTGVTQAIEPEMAPVLGQLVGFDFAHLPAVQSALTNPNFDAMAVAYLAAYFQALSDTAPVLLLLEDLHWADDRSLDLVDRLLAALPARRLLILALTRPIYYERRPDWGMGQTHSTRLDLKALSTRDSRALVAEILQRVEQLPEALRDTIVTQAEGNPFYIEELIKMLLDEGVIVRGLDAEAQWQVRVEVLDAVRVPSTLLGVLQARLDGLPASEREVLQRASVIGRQFWDAAVDYLRDTHSVDEAVAVNETLLALRGRELVFRRERSAFEGAQEYLFKHALLREVTYESVLKRLRRTYHQRAAEWLIQVAGTRVDEYATLIAEHFALAEDAAHEAEWRCRTGKRAAAQYAHAEALSHLNRALELLPQDEATTRFDLFLELVKIYDLQGQREAQRQNLAELEILAHSLDDPAHQADIALQLSQYHKNVGDYPAAYAAGQRALEWAEAAGDQRRLAEAHERYGAVLFRMSNCAEAKAHFEKGLELARAAGDRRLEASTLIWLGSVAGNGGDTHACRILCEEALILLREMGDILLEATALRNLGAAFQVESDYVAAEAAYQQALQLFRRAGERRLEGWALRDLGELALGLGDYQAAHFSLEEALRVARKLGDHLDERASLLLSGYLAFYQRRYLAAQAIFQKILDSAHERVIGRANALEGLGVTLMGLGRPSDASAAFHQALDLFRDLGWPNSAAGVEAELAGVFLAQDSLPQALQHTETALHHFEAVGNFNDTTSDITSPMRTYLLCIRVLQTARDPRARSLLECAYRELMVIANQLDDTRRRSFLENVPHNQEIVALWETREVA
jgi:class 3 adenylate cyclase/tetratricopeptide (TPR) repeat protein